MQSFNHVLILFCLSAAPAVVVTGCYTPATSQKYFVKASMDDPALEPIYSTALYTVYFDYALARCVVHSTHTWGQQGGGGGGTGIGINAFRCDPNRVRHRAENFGLTTYPPKMTPVVTPTNQRSTAPVRRTAPAPANSGTTPPPAIGGAQ